MMTPEEIKHRAAFFYEQINNATKGLEELRTVFCKHEKTHEGLYSWRIGSMVPATICDYCGDVIKYSANSHAEIIQQIITE